MSLSTGVPSYINDKLKLAVTGGDMEIGLGGLDDRVSKQGVHEVAGRGRYGPDHPVTIIVKLSVWIDAGGGDLPELSGRGRISPQLNVSHPSETPLPLKVLRPCPASSGGGCSATGG